MSRFAIDLDLSKCVACGACVIACYDQNDIDVENGQPGFRNIYEIENINIKHPYVDYLSVSCMHCDPAPCIEACPSKCIYKDPDTHLTVYNTTNCISCHSCALACPHGIPTFGLDGKMQKCDGCYMRIKYGYQPACVKVCPTAALRLIDLDQESPIKKENSLRYQSTQE